VRRLRRPDRMTQEERDSILIRDRMCFLYRMDSSHACRDAWGLFHNPHDFWRLTVDHVKDAPMMGKRGTRGVAMCHFGNVSGPSREVRQAERAYLDSLGVAA